jgi:hypothetical protein
MNWQTFSELSFSFRLTLTTALESIGFSMIMGWPVDLFRRCEPAESALLMH